MKLNVGLGIVAVVITLAALSPHQVRADEYGVVRGRVLDAESGQGVSGADVRIIGGDRSCCSRAVGHATTGSQGYFSFLGLAPGRYVVVGDRHPPSWHGACTVEFADVWQGEATTVSLTWT